MENLGKSRRIEIPGCRHITDIKDGAQKTGIGIVSPQRIRIKGRTDICHIVRRIRRVEIVSRHIDHLTQHEDSGQKIDPRLFLKDFHQRFSGFHPVSAA